MENISLVLTKIANQRAKLTESDLVGTKILPIQGVELQSGQYPKIDIDSLGSAVADASRVPGSAYKRVDYKITTDTYTTKDAGLEVTVDDSQKKFWSSFGDLAKSKTELLVDEVLRLQESEAIPLVTTASYFPSTNKDTVSVSWADTSAKIVNDMVKAKKSLIDVLGGYIGSAKIYAAMSADVWYYVSINQQVQGMLSGGTGSENLKSLVTKEQFAQICGLDGVFVSGLLVSGSRLFPADKVLLFVDSPDFTNGLCFGRTFVWTAENPEGQLFVTETYREEQKRSDIIRVRYFRGLEVFDYRAGYLLDVVP